MKLEVKKLNGLLSDLDKIRIENKPIQITEIKKPTIDKPYRIKYEYYDMGLGMGAFLRLTIKTDITGIYINGIRFIKGEPSDNMYIFKSKP